MVRGKKGVFQEVEKDQRTKAFKAFADSSTSDIGDLADRRHKLPSRKAQETLNREATHSKGVEWARGLAPMMLKNRPNMPLRKHAFEKAHEIVDEFEHAGERNQERVVAAFNTAMNAAIEAVDLKFKSKREEEDNTRSETEEWKMCG